MHAYTHIVNARILTHICTHCFREDQFNLSLDPVTARSFHDATLPQASYLKEG